MVPEGKFVGTVGARPEFETILALGSKCGLDDPEALLHLSNLCNRLGLDTNSTGSVIAFAMDLYDRRIISDGDTGGLEVTWGNAEVMDTLIHQIAKREGFGLVLSMGVCRAAQIINRGSQQFAYHVKGLELSGSDPRGLMGTALGYALSTRGADFSNVYALPETRWSAERCEGEFGIREIADRFSGKGKAKMVRRCMIVCAVIDCLGICKVPALSIVGDFDLKGETELTQALTDLPVDSKDLSEVGERVLNVERLFNLSQGATSADDMIPDFFIDEAVAEGPGEGKKVENMDSMIKEFYDLMQWDQAGIPTKEKLGLLGLAEGF